MTTNPAESGPHVPGSPDMPEPEVVESDMPGVDPDWPQTARGTAPEENESVEG